jgi:hypothetical protein
MKKPFVFLVAVFIVIMGVIYLNISYLNIYNTDIFHPLFGALLPLVFLLFFSSFLKNIRSSAFFTALAVFIIIEFVLLSQIEPICSQLICYDRTQAALILSSLFSIIYFIVLLIKNKKSV